MAKYSTASDPAWAGAMSNLVSLFDPKAQAEGSTLLAKRAALEAEARKTGMESDLLGVRLGAVKTKPEGMSDLAFWAAQAANSSTPDSIIGGHTRLGAYDASMSGDPNRVRAAAGYLHGIQPASSSSAGILSVDPITGKATMASTDYSKSIVGVNDAASQAALARATASEAAARLANERAANLGSTAAAKPPANERKGQLFQPYVPGSFKEEADELARLFSYKGADGFTTVNPDNVDVIQKIIGVENSLMQSGLADRAHARDLALSVLGKTKYRRPDLVEKGTFFDTTTSYAEPASADPVNIDAHGDVGNITEIPADQLDTIKSPGGPVMSAGHGEHFKIGNTIYMKVITPDGRSGLQRVQ